MNNKSPPAPLPVLPKTFTITPVWGSFGPSGWHHNPLLALSAHEQWRQNTQSGIAMGRPMPPSAPADPNSPH